MPINLVLGPPCAGKTTYVLEHRGADDVVVDFDDIAKAFGASTKPAAIQYRRIAHPARNVAVKKVLENPNDTAWIIFTKTTAEFRETVTALGGKIIELDPGIEVCLERAKAQGLSSEYAAAITDWYKAKEQAGKNMGKIRHKSVTAEFKTVSDNGDRLAEGEFIGYASVFNNVDCYGDRVLPGAFTKTLAEDYGSNGAGVPCYWNHKMDDPFMNIGSTITACEDDNGLKVHVRLDLENEYAKYVHKLLKENRVGQMSFSYTVEAGEFVEDDIYEISQCKLFEVSITPVGANQATEILDVKTYQSAMREAFEKIKDQLPKELFSEVDTSGTIEDLEAETVAEEPQAKETVVEGKIEENSEMALAKAVLALANTAR